jgi:ribosomal protein L37AE/L43A
VGAARRRGGAPVSAADVTSSGERVTAYYCPYCAGEDLRPAGERHGEWECRGCTRVFAVRFIGLAVRS